MARFRIRACHEGEEIAFREVARIDSARSFAEKQIERIAALEGVESVHEQVREARQRARVFLPTDFMTFILGASSVRIEAVA